MRKCNDTMCLITLNFGPVFFPLWLNFLLHVLRSHCFVLQFHCSWTMNMVYVFIAVFTCRLGGKTQLQAQTIVDLCSQHHATCVCVCLSVVIYIQWMNEYMNDGRRSRPHLACEYRRRTNRVLSINFKVKGMESRDQRMPLAWVSKPGRTESTDRTSASQPSKLALLLRSHKLCSCPLLSLDRLYL